MKMLPEAVSIVFATILGWSYAICQDFLPLPEERLEFNIDDIHRNHTDLDRKAGGKIRVQPVPSNGENNRKHMSPPKVVYQPYCINGYVFLYVTIYGERNIVLNKTFIQQFDNRGRGIPCK